MISFVYQMKRKDIKKKMKEYFFVNPTIKFRVRELERILEFPLPSIIKYCKEFENEGILTKEKHREIVFYKPSRNQEFFIQKRLYNIKSLYESGLIEYLRKELLNPAIVLFGSYSKGEDIESSDIDIYIETLSSKKISLEKYEKILKRKIQVFKKESLSKIDNAHLANNIINGTTLNNYIEVF